MRGKEQIDQKKKDRKKMKKRKGEEKKIFFVESKLCKTNYFTEERPS